MIILLDSRKNPEESQNERESYDEVTIYGEFLTTLCKYYAFNFATLSFSFANHNLYRRVSRRSSLRRDRTRARFMLVMDARENISVRALNIGLPMRSSRDVSSTNWKIRIPALPRAGHMAWIWLIIRACACAYARARTASRTREMLLSLGDELPSLLYM